MKNMNMIDFLMSINKFLVDKTESAKLVKKPIPRDESYNMKRGAVRIKHISQKRASNGEIKDLTYNDFKNYIANFDKELKN